MAITAGDVVWNITGDTSGLKKAVDESVSQVTSLKDKFINNSTAIGGGFLAMGTVITGGLAAVIASTAEAEKTTAQLEAVLKSTAGVAGMTRGALDEMASSLQKQTTYGDEAIRSAQSLLLTFTNIGKDVFPEALSTVLDMSTALGQDLKSSSIQLGKALQDPILGMTALRRVGVNFSADQIEMVKGMVETGRTMEAQKFILQELATEFGGSASAAADTFSGRLQQISNSLGDLSEAIGFALLGGDKPQGAKDFLVVLRETIDAMSAFVMKNNEVIQVVGGTLGVFGLISIALGSVILAIKPFIVAWGWVSAAITAVSGASASLATAMGGLSSMFGGLVSAGSAVVSFISSAFVAAFAAAVAAVAAAAIAISSEWENIKKLFSDFLGWVYDWGVQIVDSVYNLGASLGAAFIQMFTDPIGAIQTAWDGLKQYFMSWFDWLSSAVSSAANILYNLIPNLGVGPQAVMEFVGGMIPGFAAGGTVQSGGFIRVGETGPEIIAVPPQTKVMPGKGGAGVGSGVNVNITVSNPTFMDDAMMNRFNVGIGRVISEQLRTTGAIA